MNTNTFRNAPFIEKNLNKCTCAISFLFARVYFIQYSTIILHNRVVLFFKVMFWMNEEIKEVVPKENEIGKLLYSGYEIEPPD